MNECEAAGSLTIHPPESDAVSSLRTKTRAEESSSMSHYTAAQLRNAWKPVMLRLGFRIERSCFVKRYEAIEHSVVFQRRSSSSDVLVKLFVCITDPFESDGALKNHVCLHACLHRDGTHFFSAHWDETELATNSAVFEQFGPPFFERFQSIERLIAIVEAAQSEFQSPEAYLRGRVPSPDDPAAREFLSSLPKRRRAPIPANEELLALLHWHRGNIARALQHVRRYLELLPDNHRMKSRLAAMTRPVL